MNKLTVYKASAGSGKTFQLAVNYVCHLLSEKVEGRDKRRLFRADNMPSRHREILAITFTNKATQEMKARIISVLRELTDVSTPSAYRSRLLELIDTDARQLAASAGEALRLLLFDFGGINVSTIDSFFQSVLRSFAYEADLSGNYDLSLEDKMIIELAIAQTLDDAADFSSHRFDNLRAWLRSFVGARLSRGEDAAIFSSQGSMSRSLLKFVASLSGEQYQVNDSIRNFLAKPDAVARLNDALGESLETSTREVRELSRTAQPYLSFVGSRQAEFIVRLSAGDFENITDAQRRYVSEALAAPDADAWDSGFFPKSKTKKIAASELAAARGVLYDMLRMLSRVLTAQLMLRQIHYLGLFVHVMVNATKIKNSRNTIMLSDTTALLRRIIGDCPTPFVYERIGQRLKNFLIDEFQDTSRMQWLNLRPLLTESLSQGHDNLIIGDVKQCIYRFRNAEPELLDSQLEHDGSIKGYIEVPRLDTNYRSAKTVVEFNSALFDALSHESVAAAHAYSTVFQNAAKANLQGYVNICAVENAEKSLDFMVEEMSRQLSSDEGHYQPGDIVVLVRTGKEGEKVVERLLAESRGGKLDGVEVLSDEALFVRNSRAVQHIIATLRELNRLRLGDSVDDLQEGERRPRATDRDIEWLKETICNLNAKGVEGEEAIARTISLFNQNKHRVPIDPETDAELRSRARGLSLFEVVEQIIAVLPDSSWSRDEAVYINAFQDLVVEFCAKSSPSLANFLALWDSQLEDNAAVGLAAGVNAIRVMTIHKSKGLEFPCVHIPLLDMPLRREDTFRWYGAAGAFELLGIDSEGLDFYPIVGSSKLKPTPFDAEYQLLADKSFIDTINVLYVAFTRACNELSVSMPLPTVGYDSRVVAAIARVLHPDRVIDKTDVWTYTAGAPTGKSQSKEPEDAGGRVNTLNIDQYVTSRRSDLWDFTLPSEEQDDI